MISFSKEYFGGDETHNRWIVRLEIQGEYTRKELTEFAGHFHNVCGRYLSEDEIERIALGEINRIDATIQLKEPRKCLRYTVYNILTRPKAELIREALNKCCTFFSILHSSVKVRPKPPPTVITPDILSVRPTNGRLSL